MKSKTKLVVGVSLLTLVFAFGGQIAAHGDEEHAEGETLTAQASETPAEKQEKLKQRLQERKEKRQIRLTFAKKTRLQARCKNAQGRLSSVEGRIKGIETSRTQVYSNLLDRLTKLAAKLKERGLDTAVLDTQLEGLKSQIETFNTDLANYKQAVADLAAMDCAADPEGFQASLEAARELRATLRQSGQAIRDFLKTPIKATLKQLRDQLSAEKTEDTEDTQQPQDSESEGEQ